MSLLIHRIYIKRKLKEILVGQEQTLGVLEADNW